jgi:hypothetical protein
MMQKNMKKIEKDENGLKWSTKITSNNWERHQLLEIINFDFRWIVFVNLIFWKISNVVIIHKIKVAVYF